jgi:hypothetical protein
LFSDFSNASTKYPAISALASLPLRQRFSIWSEQ